MLAEVIREAFKRPNKMTPVEWAEEVYRLPHGGRFRFSYAPYIRRIYTELFNPDNIETCLCLYSRGLKSTAALLLIGYCMDQDPRRILSLWPTKDHAEKWRKDIVNGELLDCTPCLERYGSGANTRENSNTLTHINFPGGLLDIMGANSPGDIRRSKGNVLYAEEVDAIKKNIGDEGNPLRIFWKRGDEYPDTIRIIASYPSLKGHSTIEKTLERSDHNEWQSVCTECGGEPFVMHRNMIIYDDPKDVRFTCPRCGELLTEEDRIVMAHEQGYENWMPKNEFKGFRGFHANGMLWPHPVDRRKYPCGLLSLIATQEVEASQEDDPQRALRVIVNTFDAEAFDPSGEEELPPSWKAIYESREDYGLVIPEGGLYLTCYIDVHGDRLEMEWKAWGENEISWGMDITILDGSTKEMKVWQDCETELQRAFKHAKGFEMRLDMAMIDGGWHSEYVMRFLRYIRNRQTPGVYGRLRATKGFGDVGKPIVGYKMGAIDRNSGLMGHHINTWAAKDLIYHRLRKPDESRIMKYNLQFTEQFFEQLTVEKVTIVFEGADEIRKYDNEAHARNEALDLEVGNLACIRLRQRGPSSWDVLKKRIDQMASDAKAEEETRRGKRNSPRGENRNEHTSTGMRRGWKV